MMKNLLSNWKTTFAGLGLIVGGVVHLAFAWHAHGLTEADCTATVLSILTGVGFLAAGDAGGPPPAGANNNGNGAAHSADATTKGN